MTPGTPWRPGQHEIGGGADEAADDDGQAAAPAWTEPARERIAPPTAKKDAGHSAGEGDGDVEIGVLFAEAADVLQVLRQPGDEQRPTEVQTDGADAEQPQARVADEGAPRETMIGSGRRGAAVANEVRARLRSSTDASRDCRERRRASPTPRPSRSRRRSTTRAAMIRAPRSPRPSATRPCELPTRPPKPRVLARARWSNGNQREISSPLAGYAPASAKPHAQRTTITRARLPAKPVNAVQTDHSADVGHQHPPRPEAIRQPPGRHLPERVGEEERGQHIAGALLIERHLLLEARRLHNRRHANAVQIQQKRIRRGDPEQRVADARSASPQVLAQETAGSCR